MVSLGTREQRFSASRLSVSITNEPIANNSKGLNAIANANIAWNSKGVESFLESGL